MKEIARSCCGSCINFIVEYDYDNGYEIKCENTLISTPRKFCENYKPYNPIKNYEDELLEVLMNIYKVQFSKGGTLVNLNSTIRNSKELIEKVIGKKWEEILNEISK